ncbi:hypothetical protein PHISP_02058 [Aspergillus sp. HF37]|nr:hypothetical protein PHISP_02058 [Aspergillus sp. HF37]
MPRSNTPVSKIFYKGRVDDFIVFVDDLTILNDWRRDRSIPLSRVLNGWKIFVTHSHGSQGVLDGASKASLDNEFGTAKDDECMVKILEMGEYQTYTPREQQGDKDVRNGSAMLSR